MPGFTYGCELEWGDVPRSIEIPEELGSWDMTETDIINMRPPYQYVAADPLGINPPVGGEINTAPTHTIQGQVEIITALKKLFPEEPTVGCRSHTHIHIFVPGLREDIVSLKKIVKYLGENQEDMLAATYPFKPHPMMRKQKGATYYFKQDGGLRMPQWMAKNLVEKTHDFDTFIKMHRSGKAGIRTHLRPYRYCLNTYWLSRSPTLEFRCFRGSTDESEIESCFRFANRFIESALEGGPSVKEILSQEEFNFPPFNYSPEANAGWMETKCNRVEKVRKFNDISKTL